MDFLALGHPFLPRIFCLLLPFGSLRATNLTDGRLKVDFSDQGTYQVSAKSSGWVWRGILPGIPSDVKVGPGHDAVGDYHAITFAWSDQGRPLTGSIRLYDGRDLLLFSDTLVQASAKPAAPFPNFTTVPAGLFPLSYEDNCFAKPLANLKTTSSPWLFFDANHHAALFSAASHFLIATLSGDGMHQVASGFNPKLAHLPAGFTQQTLLAMSDGINHTFDIWGQALTDLQGKKRPASDADTVLKYFGYWTDRGAAYYYNYDVARGYAGTVKAVIDDYRRKQIPVHYLQLDSWWYRKTFTGVDGKIGKARNAKLPAGDWNCYGGTSSFTASTAIFPHEVKGFDEELGGLPLMTHNRWIDLASPYRQRFQISGIVAIDPGFWDEIAAYLQNSGFVTYEQDWLNEIFRHSPLLESTVDQGDLFLDNMARATKAQGITLQYCMGLPRCFLQGTKYDNLTTVRTSEDRFGADRYHNFLYTSRFASALGEWPWSDVFFSREADNMLLCNLSAGPVGTGDALGQEDTSNISKAVRADGVIVKPDAALVPTDDSYINEARKVAAPLVATTYSDHGGLRTIYAIAFSKKPVSGYALDPRDLGLAGLSYAYDYAAQTGQKWDGSTALQGPIVPGHVTYQIIAPVGRSGIAFLGDRDKFVSNGKQRIASLTDQPGQLAAEVLFAPTETQVTLHGYADVAPTVEVLGGHAGAVQYDAATRHFLVSITPDSQAPLDHGTDPVRHVTVTFKMAPNATP